MLFEMRLALRLRCSYPPHQDRTVSRKAVIVDGLNIEVECLYFHGCVFPVHSGVSSDLMPSHSRNAFLADSLSPDLPS